MKQKPSAFFWLLILVLAFLVVILTGWMVYRYNMNLLDREKKPFLQAGTFLTERNADYHKFL